MVTRTSGRLVDLTGQRFGRLVVKGRGKRQDYSTRTEAHWECECTCGNKITARSDMLRIGNQISCGCWRSATKQEKQNDAVVGPTTGRRRRVPAS